jgi:hypothetical protein
MLSHKHKRIRRQHSAETAEQINIDNRYESLSHMHSTGDITGNVSETDTANEEKEDPNLHHSTYTASQTIKLVLNLAKAVDEKTYFTKTRSNNTERISTLLSETYRELIRHIQDDKILHHMCQIKLDRVY